MTSKKSLFILLRISFVLFSVQFLRDTLYYWDGYSYYMKVVDFLPDFSLAYILWSISGALLAGFAWIGTVLIFKLCNRWTEKVQLQHIMMWIIISSGMYFLKTTYISSVSFKTLLNLDHRLMVVIGLLLTGIIIWIIKEWMDLEKIFVVLDDRLRPLVWLFGILCLLSVPGSLWKYEDSVIEEGNIIVPAANVQNRADSIKRPNIVLLTVDALTARDMQLYGYNLANTPFLYRYAKKGIVFQRTYATSNWTTPTSMSLMTGQRPWTHRVWYEAIHNPVLDYEQSMPAVLKRNGYTMLAYVQNNHAHPSTLGIGKYFDKAEPPYNFSIHSTWWFARLGNLFINRPIVRDWIFLEGPMAKKILPYRPETADSIVPAELVFNSFLRDIKDINTRPFFAWLHILPPHEPYLPPAGYSGKFGSTDAFSTEKKQYHNFLFNAEYDKDKQDEVSELRKRYDEFILYVDDQIKKFLTVLAKEIDLSNTAIIITADHGESFSHGFLAHNGPHLYEPLVQIPLIIKYPAIQGGRVIDSPVSQIDIAPTILSIAGLSQPSWMEGRSLLQMMKGIEVEKEPIFAMQLIRNRAVDVTDITEGTFAVWLDNYKLIYHLGGKSLLFDIDADPGENENIVREFPGIEQRLRKIILDKLSQVNQNAPYRLTNSKLVTR